MTPLKNAIIGLHDPGTRGFVLESIRQSYQTKLAKNAQEIIEQCDHSLFDLCIMDLNFGYPGGLTLAPAQQVYDAWREKKSNLGKESTGIYFVSNRTDLILAATERNLPAYFTPEFVDVLQKMV